MAEEECVDTHLDFVAGVLHDGAGLGKECWAEGDAAYKSVPFVVVTTEEMSVGKGHAELVASEIKMLGGSEIDIGEIELNIGAVGIEYRGAGIVDA